MIARRLLMSSGIPDVEAFEAFRGALVSVITSKVQREPGADPDFHWPIVPRLYTLFGGEITPFLGAMECAFLHTTPILQRGRGSGILDYSLRCLVCVFGLLSYGRNLCPSPCM